MCLLLALVLVDFFFSQQPLKVLMKQTRQAVHAIKQSIVLRCLWLFCNLYGQNLYVLILMQTARHRDSCIYQKAKINCLSLVMCLLLALVFQGFFLFQPFNVLMKQTKQTVHAINLSILLRCVWLFCNLYGQNLYILIQMQTARHRDSCIYQKAKINCLRFVMCLLLALVFQAFFFVAAI